jgi:hypothetical protein
VTFAAGFLVGVAVAFIAIVIMAVAFGSTSTEPRTRVARLGRGAHPVEPRPRHLRRVQ